MTEREKLDANDQRKEIFKRDNYACRKCGKSIYTYGTAQLAHGIANTKQNRKRYRLSNKEINHPLNLFSVCSLYCNDACNIGNRPADAWALVEKIRDALLKE